MIQYINNVSEMVIIQHYMTPTKISYPIQILSHTINITVLTRIAFSTDTIVPEEYSSIHCFNPINIYALIGYNRIINQNMVIPRKSKISPFGP